METIIEKIESLIEKDNLALSDLDLNQKDDSGYNALMTSVLRNNFPVVELLLRSGADPNIENNNAETALMIAVENENYPMVKVLSHYVDLYYENEYGDTALAYAKYFKCDDIINFLTSEGAKDSGKMTRMEQNDIELEEDERQNTANLNEIYPNKAKHPFFERLEILKTPSPHRCNKYYCTTCGGIIHHINKNMTLELKQEIEKFISEKSEEELNAIGSSSKQLQKLIDLSKK